MQFQQIIVLITVGISSVLGDVSEYRPESARPTPDRALLVLPPRQLQQASASPQYVQDAEENLEKLNANVMERLRQEIGSNTGVYYVYLPDGRLQRIQYTTAPIKQQTKEERKSNDSGTSETEQSSQYKENGYKSAQAGTSNQQSNTQVVFGTNKQTTQGNQQQQQQYRTNYNERSEQQTRSYQQQTGNPSELLAQYNGPERLENAAPAPSYIASVQFTDVPPIHGPVYAYSPSPLVRIVRYANYH